MPNRLIRCCFLRSFNEVKNVISFFNLILDLFVPVFEFFV